MNHNLELAQTLPARELHELVTGDQYSAVFAELENLSDSNSATIKKERAETLGRLRGLKLATPSSTARSRRRTLNGQPNPPNPPKPRM